MRCARAAQKWNALAQPKIKLKLYRPLWYRWNKRQISNWSSVEYLKRVARAQQKVRCACSPLNKMRMQMILICARASHFGELRRISFGAAHTHLILDRTRASQLRAQRLSNSWSRVNIANPRTMKRKFWRYERSSRLTRNLSNCEREAWKKFRLQRDSNPWPLRYRCSALPTELWSHNCWEQVNFSGSIMPLRVIQHYSDWVCTAVMSNDVITHNRGTNPVTIMLYYP